MTPSDPYGRNTPRSALAGLISALGDADYDRAAYYFDLNVDQNPRLHRDAAELARRLQQALDVGGSLAPFAVRSNDPAGRVDDDLPPDRENVGLLGGGADAAPILLARGSGPNGVQIWRVSHDTIRALMKRPASQLETAGKKDIDAGPRVAGAPLLDWLALIALAVVSFVLLRLLAAVILLIVRQFFSDPQKHPAYAFAHAALPPLALYGAVVVFYIWGDTMPVSIVARQTLLRYAGIVAWIALAWFFLRLIDAITDFLTHRMRRRERRQAISIITLLRRAAKIALFAIALVAILDTVDVDVTTGIAALGIGGIALALGAQKTIENLVGSVTVVIDRPVQIGDFCKVGDVLGTVEEIGMRSTRIRTLDRTIVTIPNGNLSSLQIDNYAPRDRFFFSPVIGLEYGIGAEKLKAATAMIEQVLIDHDKILDDGARARFVDFGDSALKIEIFAYIMAADYAESLIHRQDLLLKIMAGLDEMGLSIAFPSRALYLHHDRGEEESTGSME